jgi:hypothetical protein
MPSPTEAKREPGCNHPPNVVTADILEGDFIGWCVQWCQRCGAYRRGFVSSHHTAGWQFGEWRIPLPDEPPASEREELLAACESLLAEWDETDDCSMASIGRVRRASNKLRASMGIRPRHQRGEAMSDISALVTAFHNRVVGTLIRGQKVESVELCIDTNGENGSRRYFLYVHFFEPGGIAAIPDAEQRLMRRVFWDTDFASAVLDQEELEGALDGSIALPESRWVLSDEHRAIE